jgi:predicted molibdopterin-dependent oxidoreductase YjgC
MMGYGPEAMMWTASPGALPSSIVSCGDCMTVCQLAPRMVMWKGTIRLEMAEFF